MICRISPFALSRASFWSSEAAGPAAIFSICEIRASSPSISAVRFSRVCRAPCDRTENWRPRDAMITTRYLRRAPALTATFMRL